jgi:hypothetical protein
MTTHQGSCHCGEVRFEVDLDLSTGATRCNCSVCQKLALLGKHCKPTELRVLSGDANLATYEWGGRTAQRYFCKTCGVHVFARGYLEQLGGDYASINVNCLDDIDPSRLTVGYWDGRHNNWQAGMASKPWPVFTPEA